jgi:hypothetical protein
VIFQVSSKVSFNNITALDLSAGFFHPSRHVAVPPLAEKRYFRSVSAGVSLARSNR